MPDAIDERWEYWTPSEEWSEAFDDEQPPDSDRIPTEVVDRGRAILAGYRVCSRPDDDTYLYFRLGHSRYERPDRLPLRRCRSCPRLFTPRRDRQKYCSLSCSPWRRLGMYTCAECGCSFRPEYRGRVFCSRECSWLRFNGRLDWNRVVELFRVGNRMTDIARDLGCNRQSVRDALKRRGVWSACRPGPPRTITDVSCGACGKVFRPHQNGVKYCSVKCGAVVHKLNPIQCQKCGVTFTPRRKKFKFCSPTCSLSSNNEGRRLDSEKILGLHAEGLTPRAIGERMGCSPISVRHIIRKHRTTNTESGT